MSARWRTRGSQHLSPPQNNKTISNYKSDENGSGKALEHNKEVEEMLQSSETKDSCKGKHRKHFACPPPPWVQAPELSCCPSSTAPVARAGHWAIIAMLATASSWPLAKSPTLPCHPRTCAASGPHIHRGSTSLQWAPEAQTSVPRETRTGLRLRHQSNHHRQDTYVPGPKCCGCSASTWPPRPWLCCCTECQHTRPGTRRGPLREDIKRERTPASFTSEDYNSPSSHCHSEILYSRGRRKPKDDVS